MTSHALKDAMTGLEASYGRAYAALLSNLSEIKFWGGYLTEYGLGMRESAAYILMYSIGSSFAESRNRVDSDMNRLVAILKESQDN